MTAAQLVRQNRWLIIAAFVITVALLWWSSSRTSEVLDHPISIEDAAAAQQAALSNVWESQTPQERFDLCSAYNTRKDRAWESFDSGAQGSIMYDVWDQFMDGSC